jgi:WD40 repeat protein
VRVWRSSPGRATFDLQAPKKLTQHTGPVSSVALSAANIFSGSWDYSVRVWSRDTLKQLALLSFPDWVDCLAPRWAKMTSSLSCFTQFHGHVCWSASEPPHYINGSRGQRCEAWWLYDMMHHLIAGAHTFWWPLARQCTCTAWRRRSGFAQSHAHQTRWTSRPACASRDAATPACSSRVC